MVWFLITYTAEKHLISVLPDAHRSYTGLLACHTCYLLGQMSAGTGLLGPVRLSNTESVAQSRDAGLQVELGGLRQVRLLAEVVEIKQCGAALHLGLHQGRGSDLRPKTNKQKKATFLNDSTWLIDR